VAQTAKTFKTAKIVSNAQSSANLTANFKDKATTRAQHWCTDGASTFVSNT